MTHLFAPEGYTPVLPNWPVGAKPWGEQNQKLFSEKDIAEGLAIFERGLDTLAAAHGAEPALVDAWRPHWENFQEFTPDTYLAEAAHLAEASFSWFSSLEEADEYGAYLGSSGYRAAAFGGHDADAPLNVRRAAGATLRAGATPTVFRQAIEEYGPRSTHRASAALQRGSLPVMLEAKFPLSYMSVLPIRWTKSLDVVAKVAYGSMPSTLLAPLIESGASALDADYLCSTLAPEYILYILASS